MKIKNAVLLSSLMSLSLSLTSAYAGDVDFDLVPVDVSKNCNALILKGTQRFKGTAYVTPKVFLTIDRNGNHLFEVLPTKNGTYIVRFALFTPIDVSNALQYRTHDSQLMTNTCSYDQIRDVLQKQAKQNASRYYPRTADGAASSNTDEDPIKTLGPLNVNSITVRVDGVDEPIVVSSSKTDIYDLFDMDHIVEFTLPNRDALDLMLARLNGVIGLGVKVNFGFKAKSLQSAIDVECDGSKIGAKIGAAFKTPTVTPVQLSAVLSNTLRSVNCTGYLEGDAFNQLAQDLVTQFSKSTFASTKTTAPTTEPEPTTEPDPKPKTEAPSLNILSGVPQKDKKPEETTPATDTPAGDGSTAPDESTAGDETTTDETPAPVELGKVSVKAFIEFANSHDKIKLKYQLMGAAEAREFETSTILHADIEDMSSRTLKVSSGGDQSKALFYDLKKGDSLDVMITHKMVQPLKSLQTVTSKALTKDELLFEYEQLHKYLPNLKAHPYSFFEKNVEENENSAAVLYEKPGVFEYLISLFQKTKVTTWGKEIRKAVYDESAPWERLELDMNKLRSLPLSFSFSKVGGSIRVAGLLGSDSKFNEVWDSYGGKVRIQVLDSGTNKLAKIRIQALEDLGLMSVYNDEVIPLDKNRPSQKMFYENTHGLFSSKGTTSYVNIGSEFAKKYQTNYQLKILTLDPSTKFMDIKATQSVNSMRIQ